MKTQGGIPQIIRNDEKLYEGNLIKYFQIVFKHDRNLQLPYHNFRHIFHVLWLCYKACKYYIDEGLFTPRTARNLLIAVLFHDFNHQGRMGNDDLNIELAIRALRQYILSEDQEYLPEIEAYIRGTEFPYKVKSEDLPLAAQVLRDADLSQALSVAWIQQVILGLAAEWNQSPMEVLSMQGPFMKGLHFHTEWAQKEFPQRDIDAKISEATDLLNLLNDTAEKI